MGPSRPFLPRRSSPQGQPFGSDSRASVWNCVEARSQDPNVRNRPFCLPAAFRETRESRDFWRAEGSPADSAIVPGTQNASTKPGVSLRGSTSPSVARGGAGKGRARKGAGPGERTARSEVVEVGAEEATGGLVSTWQGRSRAAGARSGRGAAEMRGRRRIRPGEAVGPERLGKPKSGEMASLGCRPHARCFLSALKRGAVRTRRTRTRTAGLGPGLRAERVGCGNGKQFL